MTTGEEIEMPLTAIRSPAAQLTRFCGVGMVCLAVSTGGLAALHDLAHVYYLAAFALSFCLGNLVGYFLNGRFTFSARIHALGGLRYFLLSAILLVINSLLMKVLVDEAHVWYIGACLVVATTSTPVSFLLHRTLSYAAGSRVESSLPN